MKVQINLLYTHLINKVSHYTISQMLELITCSYHRKLPKKEAKMPLKMFQKQPTIDIMVNNININL